MTEREWLKARSSEPMLRWARPRVGARKKRLLVVAACRLLPVAGGECREVIATAERYADGAADAEEMRRARRLVGRQSVLARGRTSEFGALNYLTYLNASECCTALVWVSRALSGERQGEGGPRAERGVAAELADLVREVFGNPFRPSLIDPAWQAWGGGEVLRLAAAIYDERAFDRMPILGDALEDAGCADAALLAHCRAKRRHVRGCWALDLVLGKA